MARLLCVIGWVRGAGCDLGAVQGQGMAGPVDAFDFTQFSVITYLPLVRLRGFGVQRCIALL